MTTGIQTALGNNGSTTYTAQSNARLRVNWAGTSTNLSYTFNSVTVVMATGSAGVPTGQIETFVGAGQSVTVATGAALTALVSALEEMT